MTRAPSVRTTVAWLLVSVLVFAAVVLYLVDEIHDLVEAEEAEEVVEEAVRCIASWEVRDQIRQSDEDHGRAAGEALIEVVQPDDPAIVEQYRTALNDHLVAASGEVEDPDCDLDDARALVRDG